MRKIFFIRVLLGLWLVLVQAPLLAATPVVLVFGDSLSAAYGMDSDRSWPALLQMRLTEEGYPHRVVNASVSGETTAGGVARLPAALKTHRPVVLVLELGGNDGLRGLPPVVMRNNLTAMIKAAQAQGVKVLLVGMRLPPNYGEAYNGRFQAVYENLARRHETPLVPFLLDGVGGNGKLMQEDSIHPRVEAQERLLDNVWPHLKPLLR